MRTREEVHSWPGSKCGAPACDAFGTRLQFHGHPKEMYTWPGSNWRPSACEADVIATRPQVPDFLSAPDLPFAEALNLYAHPRGGA